MHTTSTMFKLYTLSLFYPIQKSLLKDRGFLSDNVLPTFADNVSSTASSSSDDSEASIRFQRNLRGSDEWNFIRGQGQGYAPQFYPLIALETAVDGVMSRLITYFRNSDLNIWTMCLVNAHGFLIDNPLVCPVTNKPRNQQDMVKHMGIATLSRIVQLGLSIYDQNNVHLQQAQTTSFIEILQQQESAKVVPRKEDLQKMFETSITSLNESNFALLKKILRNVWTLLPQRNPIDKGLSDRSHNKGKDEVEIKDNNTTHSQMDENFWSTTTTVATPTSQVEQTVSTASRSRDKSGSCSGERYVNSFKPHA